uniref:Odorant receptor n=1 Tax=Conogethes punctiferalis TaxID=1133088 RepID=A0A1Y9TJL9_CONPF|nr:odorant receptor 19 [Conogethes punctiferalis]
MDGFEIYHKEFLKPLIVTLKMLNQFNVRFCSSEVPFLTRNWRFFYLVPLWILHIISLMSFIVNLIMEGNDPFEEAYMIPICIISFEHCIKMCILMKKREEIRDVITNIGNIWRSTGLTDDQKKTKEEILKKLYNAGLVFNNIGIAVTIQYLMVPLFETLVRRLILKQEVELMLPLTIIYPFEIKTWPLYLVIYGFQVYSLLCAACVYLGFGWLLVVLTCYLNIQFLLLQEDLIHVKPETSNRLSYLPEEEGEITQYWEPSPFGIDDFVRQHQTVILLTDKLNAAVNKITFTIILFATLNISFFAIAVKASAGAVDMVNNFGAIIVIMMNIFILCYCSQLLSSSSSGIALAAGKNLWYKGDLSYQTKIRFIMMRSQKPCSLTSLDFSPIGLETFNKVLKTTWSYFSLASQMYDERY